MELVSIMEALEEGAYLVDRERRITYWSPTAEKITGFSSGEVTGRRCSDNILRHVSAEGIELCIHGCPLHATMSDGKLREAEAYLHHKDGHRVPVFIRAMALKNDEAEITGSIELFSDTTDRSTLLAELEHLRHEILTDPLTGLGNRRYMEIMSTARFETFKHTGVPFGVIMIDIDHFKRVNDTYGHLVGDKILKMTAKTLQGAVRPLDTAIRYGGEEMLILCPNCDLAAIGEIAERVRMLVSHSWLDEGDISRLQVTVSVGGALARTTDDLASLVARADERLYDCKRNGRNRCLVGE